MHSASLFPFHDHPNASLSSTGHHTSTHTQTDCPNKHTEDMQECLHWPTCCSNTRTKKDTDIHTHIHTLGVAASRNLGGGTDWQGRSEEVAEFRLWIITSVSPIVPGLRAVNTRSWNTHTHTILHYFPVSSFIKAKKKKSQIQLLDFS